MSSRETRLELTANQYISAFGMLPEGGSGIVGISGGADSTALLGVLAGSCARRAFALRAMHLNHGQRGEESMADEQAAHDLAAGLSIPFSSERLALRANESEAAMREARFSALKREAGRTGADRIFLGHTADDAAETMLMRLIRGAGLDGLAGFGPMDSREGLWLCRPFFACARRDVEAYLREKGVNWREDSSNRDERYMRNRIRHKVMPLLTAENASVAEAFARTSLMLREDAELLQRLAKAEVARRARYARAGECGDENILGAILETGREWADVDPAMRRRILREFSEAVSNGTLTLTAGQTESVDALAKGGDGGAMVTPGAGWVYIKEGKTLRLFQAKAQESTGRPTEEEVGAGLARQKRAMEK